MNKKTPSCAHISTMNHQRDDYGPCQGNAGKRSGRMSLLSSVLAILTPASYFTLSYISCKTVPEMPHNTTSGINRVPLHHLLILHRELVFIYFIINMQPYNLPKQVLKDCLANPAAKGIIVQGLACSASLHSQCTYHTPPSKAFTTQEH